MSYILEALRRADAERRRGAVPGLHAQPGGGVTTDREPSGRIGPLALIGVAVVMVLAGASGAWWWAVQRPIAPTPAPVPAPVPAPIAMPSVSPAPQPAVDRAATPPVVLPAESATAPPLPAVPAPALPRARPAVAAASRPGGVARADAAPDTVASAPPARLPLLAELPEALRREMAGLSINGSVYAEQPAARLVILNGQVFREGESPATDLRIEQIRPRSVVFNLRGQRFEMPM